MGKIIDPQDFLQSLAYEAESRGAYFEAGKSWIGGFSGYNAIVGADGFNSRVAREAGLNRFTPEYDLHSGVQYFMETTDLTPENISLFFSRTEVPYGYAWVFPAGKDVFEVGCGVPVSIGRTQYFLDKFVKRLGVKGRIVKITGGLIPTSKPMTKIWTHVGGKDVFLVGDACNHVDPLTGGGIHIALSEGHFAGQAILSGRPDLYVKHVKPIIRRNRLRYKLKQALYRFTDRDFDSLVKGLNGFTPRVFSPEVELPRLLARVLIKSPGLIPKIASGFLT